jgi:predicted DNA binding CopG/RHH family protein
LANRPVKLKSGRNLDQALIDKLVSEAERGYDLSQAKRVILREGRPAQGEPVGESPRVASRIPEPVYRAAKKRAAGEGLTVSQVIRALLAGYASGVGVAGTQRTSLNIGARKKPKRTS